MQIKDFIIDQNLRELTEHRTVVLPVACYETTISQNIHGYIPLHWHDEIQFVLVVKGEAIFQINEDKRIVQQGDGLFINSGCLHMAEDQNESGCVYICLNASPHFVLSQELYTPYVAPYIQATNLPYVHINSDELWGKNIVDAMLKINQCIQQKSPYYEIDITMYLTLIWKNLVMNGFPLEYDQVEMVKSLRIKQMLNWIYIHYAEKVTLDDIARAGQLSRSECCRYFKRVLKITPLNYVMDYRIQKSLVLLRQAESNVTEVAYKVGFNSTSYFIERFRKAMNMTPLAYKKLKMDD
ncbi:AraC family transcriptional regulator [Paenibacillus polymyxa]|uniref:AraC family transcriptional regulator n=1 Tax=Paenibacillus polymyxa TaxID=1406 RepID=UPI0025B6F7C5|nr:AraC family transcriptional regulator [Paenibacillus polymyxa]MDN4076493.1 AraC family transcriptional regulator [Paenibacillus polymyxa]MDN4101919.1 AraC family transcriptional regulator [Paenibacillus polymyxa]MDN4112136.1 AraC family transcriptional regulator [Paenibacillus polymyxa]